MTQIKVVMPGGGIAHVSSDTHDEEGLKNVIKNRQQVAYDYCMSKGWPTDPTQLSFEQIIEIRETKQWIEAGK